MAKVVINFRDAEMRQRAQRGMARPLVRAGSYVRKVARNSIKKRAYKNASAPGTPPHTHATRALKNSILWDKAADNKSVIIGASANLISDIAHTHEFGGMAAPKRRTTNTDNWILQVGGHGPIRYARTEVKRRRKTSKRPARRGRAVGDVVVAKLRTQEQVARARRIAAPIRRAAQLAVRRPRLYPKRPFMAPALQASIPKILTFFRDSIK
jgi:hypothetical protein